MECLEFDKIAANEQTAFVNRDETEAFIRKEAEERRVDKGDTRIKAEAEAYAIVANWGEGPAHSTGTTGIEGQRTWKIGVLSQGGYLNRIARQGPHTIDRHIVVPPDAL